LTNDIRVLTFSNFNVSSVYLIGLLRGGSAYDPADKLGLSHFTVSMLSRGTSHRDFNSYHRELEDRGANLGFSCGANHISFRGRALAEDLETLFDLAADSLQFPAFSPEYYERLRSQLLASLAIRDQDPSEISSILFDRELFPGHPYGQPKDGYADTIQNIQLEDLVDFHKTYFSPEKMILVATGAVTPAQTAKLAEKYFSSWNTPNAKKKKLPPLPDAPRKIIRKHQYVEDKSQVDLTMGTIGPSRTSEDYLPVYLGNNVLGQFGLMGRIGESVRTRSGLAYYASSNVTAWSDSGSWEFSAGTSAQNLEKTIQLIREEIKRFVSSSVSDEELDDSQSNLIGRLPMALESNAGLANSILTMERFELGLDYYQRYASMLKSIKSEDIMNSAQKYLDPERLVITSAGPGDDIS
jgi:zinc protease